MLFEAPGGYWVTQTPAAWLQWILKSNWSSERQTPFFCTVPGHNPLKDGVVCWNTMMVITCSSLPEVSLLSIFSGISGGTRRFHLTGHCGRSQDVSEVVVLCVWGIHLLPGHPETQCVSWGWQHSAQPYGAFTCWFFSAWGSSLFHRWLLCSPRIGGCPWSRCAAAEPSILLSYPIAMAGKAGFVPSCLCWYCLLLAICVVSLLAFFLSENDMSCP